MQTSHQQQQQSAPSQARTIHQSQRHPMSPREHMQQARSLPQHSSHAMQANHSPLLNTQQMATPAIPYHAPANQVQSTTNQRMPSTHTPSHALSPPPLHNNTQAASIASQIDTAALQFALQKQMFLNQSLLAQQNQLRMEMGMQPTTDDGSTTSPAPHYTQPSPISFNRTPEPSFPPNHMMQQHQHHQQQLYPPSSHGMNVRHGSVSPPNSGGFGIGTLPMTRAPSLDAAMSSSPPPIKPEPHVKLETSVRRPQKSKRAAMHDDDSVSESEEDLDAGSHSDSSSPAASDNDDGTSSQASATESDSGPDEDDDMDIPPPKRQSTGGSKDEPRATPVQKRKPKQQSAGGSRAKQSTSAKKDSKEKEKSPSSSPVLNAHGKPKRLRGMSCHQCKTRRTSLDLCHCGQAHVKKSTSARARKRKKERMCRKKCTFTRAMRLKCAMLNG